MKCPKCEQELPEGIKYCVFCGAKLFSECPGCKKVIGVEQEVCEFCNLNIPAYHQSMALLEEGKELERKWKYEEAKSIYERITQPEIVANEATKLLNEVLGKIKVITEDRFKGEEWLKSRKWGKAKRVFLEVQNLLPEDEDVGASLELIRACERSRFRKIWLGVGIIIILAVVGGFYWHTYTFPYMVRSELKSLLSSDNLDVRNSAALLLGWQGDKSGIPILKVLANSGDPRKSVYSLSALLRLGKSDAVDRLEDVVRSGSVAGRIGAAWALVEFGDTAIIPELVAYLNSANNDLRIAASVLLFNLGYSLGLPVIEEALSHDSSDIRFKGLYSLYLLGDKRMLVAHEESWVPLARDLLWDRVLEVRLITAFLLNEFSTDLTLQDSLAIERILWEEFMVSKGGAVPEVGEMAGISAFYIAKGIINRRGDEDIVGFSPSAKEIREKCRDALSRIELKDELVKEEVERAFGSSNKYERLWAALTLLKRGKKETIPTLKELIKDKDEVLRLNTCKLVSEFI